MDVVRYGNGMGILAYKQDVENPQLFTVLPLLHIKPHLKMST
jgi:hypothetical protein